MGQVVIQLSDLPNGKVKDDWFTLVPQKTGDPVSGELHLKLQLVDKSKSKKKLQMATNPLVKPVLDCDYNKVDELLREGKLNINQQDEHGVTALHIACTRDVWNEGAVQVLLRYVCLTKFV